MNNGKKQEIIDKTIELCEKKAIPRITVNEICKASGCTRNSFYYHFKNIYDVLDCAIQSRLAILNDCPPEQYDKALFDVIEYTIMYKKVWKNLYKSIGQEALRDYVIGRLHSVFEGYIKSRFAGRRICEMDLGIICTYFEEALFGVLVKWIKGQSRGDTPDEMLVISDRIRTIFTGCLDLMLDNADMNKEPHAD